MPVQHLPGLSLCSFPVSGPGQGSLPVADNVRSQEHQLDKRQVQLSKYEDVPFHRQYFSQNVQAILLGQGLIGWRPQRYFSRSHSVYREENLPYYSLIRNTDKREESSEKSNEERYKESNEESSEESSEERYKESNEESNEESIEENKEEGNDEGNEDRYEESSEEQFGSFGMGYWNPVIIN